MQKYCVQIFSKVDRRAFRVHKTTLLSLGKIYYHFSLERKRSVNFLPYNCSTALQKSSYLLILLISFMNVVVINLHIVPETV